MDSEKCSLRRLRETTDRQRLASAAYLALALLLALPHPARSQADAAADSADAGVDSAAALERFVASVDSLSARYTQELWTADQRLLETEAGLFLLDRPDRFVWHTQSPIEYSVISDGETLWMYDVELEQVTRSPLADLSAANPAMLLAGGQAIEENFEIIDRFTLDGLDWVKLLPKGAGDFSSVLVAFADGAPRELELVDGLNQTTRIQFTDVAVDPVLDPGQFEFEPPRGVNVIGSVP